jgi:hypothetical protein
MFQFLLSLLFSFCLLFFVVFVFEQLPNPCGAGSNPAGGTNNFNIIQQYRPSKQVWQGAAGFHKIKK